MAQPQHTEVVQPAESMELHRPDVVVGQVQHAQALQPTEAAVLENLERVAAEIEMREELHVLEHPVVGEEGDVVLRQIQPAEVGQRREAGQVQHTVVRQQQGLCRVGRVRGEVPQPRVRTVESEEGMGGDGEGHVGAVARGGTGGHVPVLLAPLLGVQQGSGPVRGKGQQQHHGFQPGQRWQGPGPGPHADCPPITLRATAEQGGLSPLTWCPAHCTALAAVLRIQADLLTFSLWTVGVRHGWSGVRDSVVCISQR